MSYTWALFKTVPCTQNALNTFHFIIIVFALVIVVECNLRNIIAENQTIQIAKEVVKLSLFADEMRLYIENPEDAIRKLLDLINEFSKIAGYKINTQKSVVLLYTNNKNHDKIMEIIPFTITSKRIKYLGTNLLKEAKYLYSENWDTDEENWRRHKQMKRYTVFLDWRYQHY